MGFKAPTAPAAAAVDLSSYATTASVTTAVAGRAPALTTTAVKTSAYSANANELIPVNTTSGAVTITLPNAPADKTEVTVKHIVQGGANAVTIAASGSGVFNVLGGATSFTLPMVSQSARLIYKSSDAIWYVVANDLSLTQLDARYPAAAKFTNVGHPAAKILMATGKYGGLGITAAGGTATAGANGLARYHPCVLLGSGTIDKIGMEITTVGETGSKIRMGLYADNGTGYAPGALLLDAGQIATDATAGTGYKELTVSFAYDYTLVWFCYVAQSATTTPPFIRTVTSPTTMQIPAAAGGNTSGSSVVGLTESGITGAFTTAGSTSTATSTQGKFWLHAA